MFMAGVVLAILAVLTFVLPQLLAYPLAVISIWVSSVLLYKSWKLRMRQNVSPPDVQKENVQYYNHSNDIK